MTTSAARLDYLRSNPTHYVASPDGRPMGLWRFSDHGNGYVGLLKGKAGKTYMVLKLDDGGESVRGGFELQGYLFTRP